MSEEILDPAHGDNVETVVAGVPPPEAPKPEEPAERVTPDGNILERDGKKYIVYDAFESERQNRQRLSKTISDLEPLMPEFEQFLRTKEHRRTATTDAVARSGQTDDAEYLAEVATALGFYDETNAPDLRRAQAHLNITRREAERSADKRIRPLEGSNTRDRASINREKALGTNFVDGKPIADRKYMDAAVSAMPDEYMADPNIANIIQVVAAGLEYLDLRKSGPVGRGRNVREPMHLERGTGRFDGDNGEMSEFDLAAARARGKTPEQWAKLAKGGGSSKPSTGAVLEDI